MRKALRCRSSARAFASKVLTAYQSREQMKEANTIIKMVDGNPNLAGDQDHKISELLMWAMAGFDTTGVSLSNTLVLLAENPDVQEKLHQALTESPDLCAVPYLQLVIRESHRFAPAVANGSVRQTGHTFSVGQSYSIPTGAVCIMHPYTMGRDPSVFPDPTAFRPDRWQEPTPAMLQNCAPFSLGPRNCPGQPLAKAELDMAIVALVRAVRLEVVEKGGPPINKGLYKLTGYRLRAIKRSPK